MTVVDARTENNIVTGMIVSTSFLQEIQSIFMPLKVPFANTVAGWCNEYFRKYKKSPCKHIQNIFHTHVKDGSLKDDEEDLISQFLEGLSNEYEQSKGFNNDYILNETRKYFKEIKLNNLKDKLTRNLLKGNIDKAEKSISDYDKQRYSSNNKLLQNALDTLIVRADDLEEIELPKRKMLLFPWLAEGDLIMVSGHTGAGKTWFAMEICTAIRDRKSAFNDLWNVKNHVRTLYIDGEMSWDDIIERSKYLKMDKVHVLSKSIFDFKDVHPPLNLHEEEIRGMIFDIIIKSNYRFVVIDNLFSLWPGLDLNDSKEWSYTNQWLMKLRSKGISIMLLHHTNKSGDQMGTSAKLYNLNTSLLLKKAKKQTNYEGEVICSFSIDVEKSRRKMKSWNMIFTCDDGKWSVDETSESKKNEESKTQDILLLLLNGGISQKEIGRFLDCTQANVSIAKTSNSNLFNGSKASEEGKKLLMECKEELDELIAEYNEWSKM